MKPVPMHAWTEAPLRRFVGESRVRYAVLLHPSGLVLGQHGFTHAVDVMSACSRAAAIRASAGALGVELSGAPFTDLYYGGAARHIYMAEAATPRGPYMLLTVFDGESSLGLVKLFFERFRAELASAAPPLDAGVIAAPADFEKELQRGLAAVLERGPARTVIGGRG
ncbi:MAG: hypothetical protein ABJD07_00735 [Gemmatimonadaceae bacterium]